MGFISCFSSFCSFSGRIGQDGFPFQKVITGHGDALGSCGRQCKKGLAAFLGSDRIDTPEKSFRTVTSVHPDVVLHTGQGERMWILGRIGVFPGVFPLPKVRFAGQVDLLTFSVRRHSLIS